MKNRIVTDTSNFFSIDYGDIIQIGRKQYRVMGHEREQRFGMDDPKLWVKKAVDLESGENKIIKLSYLEEFESILGGIKIHRYRNPDKEGNVLALTEHHPYFMHGTTHRDTKGNNIRILDIVRGKNFLVYIDSLDLDYENYFHTMLPVVLKHLVRAFEAIRFLHSHGFKHGDIRNDHIILEEKTGNYVWIDFDYDYQSSENPYGLDLFGLGNILIYAIGMGFHTYHGIKNNRAVYGDLEGRIKKQDFSVLDNGRFLNLKKIYPIIPDPLNDIIMHFAKAANIYYEAVEEIIEDLNRCIYSFLK